MTLLRRPEGQIANGSLLNAWPGPFEFLVDQRIDCANASLVSCILPTLSAILEFLHWLLEPAGPLPPLSARLFCAAERCAIDFPIGTDFGLVPISFPAAA